MGGPTERHLLPTLTSGGTLAYTGKNMASGPSSFPSLFSYAFVEERVVIQIFEIGVLAAVADVTTRRGGGVAARAIRPRGHKETIPSR